MIRSRVLSLAVALSLSTAALVAQQPSAPEQKAVVAAVQAMFDGMAHRSVAAIRASAIPGAQLVLMRDGKASQMTIEAFADRVGKPGKAIAETIHEPMTVRVDGDLAVVWAPFDFTIEGKIDHCGTDLFNLVKVDGQWKIAGVADTGHNNCAAK